MKKLSHVDDKGRTNMVDVSNKPVQKRRAVAKGTITISKSAMDLIRENQIKKGDVLTVAQIAGISAAKRTPGLIPLCHPLGLDKIDVKLDLTDTGIQAQSQVTCLGRTGVEMEALTAVSVALLTVYDMCKAADKQMKITDITLVEKVKEDV